MANTIKTTGAILGTTKAPLLTCVAGTQVAATDLVMTNPTASAQPFSLWLYTAADATERQVLNGYSLAAGSHYRFPGKLALQPGDELRASATNASAVTVSITLGIVSAATPIAKGVSPKGVYAAATTYVTNDLVDYTNGSGVRATYISLQDGNKGNAPDTATAFWSVFAAQGPAGSGLTKATGTDLRALTDDTKYLTAKAQADAIATASLGSITGTLALDFAAVGFNPSGTATGNLTLGQHTNIVDQKPVTLEIVQDGTGSRTLAANTTYNKFVGKTVFTLSTAAGARDILYGTARVIGGTSLVHWTGIAKDVG